MRFGTAILIGAAFIALSSCGGSHNSTANPTATTGGNVIASPASNVVAAIVNAGPGPTASINKLYTSVTICAPGSTTNCQTIDHIAIDTNTSGLRIVGSVIAPALGSALTAQVDGAGNTIVECMQYADGYAWGPITTVDMKISGETAASLPIQVFGTAQYPSAPAGTPCALTGAALDSVASFGANGTLGVSVFAQDCGSACALSLVVNSAFYYACSSPATCNVTTVPVTSLSGPQQVQNPVTLFAVNNNGVILELPSVSADGATTATGALVFGIDTQTNNAFGATSIVMTVDPVHGYMSTSLKGTGYAASYFDTLSPATLFDPPIADTTLTLCTDTANANLYCPAATDNLSPTIISTSNNGVTVNLSVANADTLLSGGAGLVAFSNLAGKSPLPRYFVWGLPFFYGLNVYFAYDGRMTSVGAGPYIAI